MAQREPDTVLVTGAAGFVGYFCCQQQLALGRRVIGIDNLNDYYSPALKEARLAQLDGREGFSFQKLDIADRGALQHLFASESIDAIIHLAAQAGVRYSLENPAAYADANLLGFTNIIECARQAAVSHFVYASSSSVYGANAVWPYEEAQGVDHPVSLYAATKRANELIAHTYSHLYHLPTTGLRFFTVYGPWGRPDMAYFSFCRRILAGEPIQVFNHGKLERDFTYIDDIVAGVGAVLDAPPTVNDAWQADPAHPDPATSCAPFRVLNIGNNEPVPLMDFIATLESLIGREAKKEFVDHQPGDVLKTAADIHRLQALTGFAPHTPLNLGLARFVEWYRAYYSV